MRIKVDYFMVKEMSSYEIDKIDAKREILGIPIAQVWPEGLLWPRPYKKLENVVITPDWSSPFQNERYCGTLRIE